MKYRKRPGARIKGDADAIGKELERLRKHHRQLTPEIVVEAAKDPDSPLHGEFQWNKAKASHQWWLRTARVLIADVVIEVGEEKTIRAFANVVRGGAREYVRVQDAARDADLRAQVLGRLQDEAEDWAERAEQFSEYAAAVAAIQKAGAKVRKPRRRKAG